MPAPRIFSSLIILLLTLAPLPAAVADSSIWFEDARHSPALSDDAIRAVAAHVRHRLLDLPADEAPILPSAVRDDFFPRVLFISASDGLRAARVVTGSARGIIKAADEAIAQLRPTEKDPFKPVWLKLDHPATILLQERARLDQPLEFERSLFGVAFAREVRVAFVPEELIAGDLVNAFQEFSGDAMMAYLDRRIPATENKTLALKETLKPAAPLFRFTTQSWFMDKSEIVPLFRGHRMFTRITRDQLLASVKASATYLAQSVDRYGQFDYIFQPTLNRVADEYNIVRHMGTILSMADAYEVFKDPDLLAATKRAIDFADSFTISWMQEGKRVPGAIEEGRVTLGANALSAAALARLAAITGDKKLTERAKAFGDAILVAQQPDGSFIQYQRFPDGKVFEFDNPYYPGEAVYALMLLRKISDDQALVDAAEKAALHLINGRDKDVPIGKLLQDHWLLYGMNEVARHKPSPIFFDHTIRISEAMCQLQYRAPPFTDWLGGYYSPPGSTPTAVRTEGLISAYALLRDKGGESRRKHIKPILEACVLGAAFQLQCQYGPENSMYFRDPRRVLGATRESLTSPDIRIDFVQHSMMGLLILWRMMEEEKVEAFAVPKAEKRESVDRRDAGPEDAGD